MTDPAGPQRAYRAPCPSCGAPVEFRSAQSTHAVCAYCRSAVVREGDALKRIGRMAELFEDFSPLQLMAAGRWQGRAFTLVGRQRAVPAYAARPAGGGRFTVRGFPSTYWPAALAVVFAVAVEFSRYGKPESVTMIPEAPEG